MKTKGFTLIELLISISIVSVILVYILYFLFAGIKLYGKVSIKSQELGSSIFVLDKITADVLGADQIMEGSDPARMVLLKDDEEIIYEYKNKKVRRQKGSYARYLTIEDEIRSLNFDYLGSKVKVMLGTATDTYIFNVNARNL